MRIQEKVYRSELWAYKTGVKVKLNLTVLPAIRQKAEALATSRRRSISQLFEDLVEEAASELANKKSVSLDALNPGSARHRRAAG